MRIEKVRGNREGVAVDSNRQLCFSYEEKMSVRARVVLNYIAQRRVHGDQAKTEKTLGGKAKHRQKTNTVY